MGAMEPIDAEPNGPAGTPPRRRVWRRPIVLVALVAVTALVLGIGTLAVVWAARTVSTVGDLDFRNALRIPPLAERDVEPDGTVRFSLDLAPGRTEFLEGKRTPTWGFDGTYLGPTLRASPAASASRSTSPTPNIAPEDALRKANAKFERRFRSIETKPDFEALSLAEKEALWVAAKAET